ISKIHIAIINAVGTVEYIDSAAFDEYLYFIQNYILENFKKLAVGDVTIPFGGISLAFFKISKKAVIILHSKGPAGQLLAFKTLMFKWADRIDQLIGDLESQEAQSLPKPTNESIQVFWDLQQSVKKQKEKPKVRRIPVLTKKLTGKEKFSLQIIKFLQLCDGVHTIEEIAKMTNVPRLTVDLIIRDLIKKKVIKLKRSIK
ncbi:MAG: hypothetical protein ACTSRL_13190, partial [Candidatus Helarchaeota archaeon]